VIVNLSEQHSLVSNWINELRDINIQQDRMRFRHNLERIAEIVAYEISKVLPFVEIEVDTPLGTATSKVLKDQPVLATILRAGLPCTTACLIILIRLTNAFAAAYRKHEKDGSFEISLEYMSCPDLEGRILIISDPMLATGASLVKTIHVLKEEGPPKEIHVVCAIACTVGIEYVKREDPSVTIWCGDIDEELTAKGYIVPGWVMPATLLLAVKARVKSS
jgi:uracil phosphoribosyltransferase